MPGPRRSRSRHAGRRSAPASAVARRRSLPGLACEKEGGLLLEAALSRPRRQGDRIGDHTILDVAVGTKGYRSVLQGGSK